MTRTLKSLPGLEIRLARLIAGAEAAAGAADAPVARAQAYFALWRASHGVCAFALIAAHGALWGNWYLRLARFGAMALALADRRSSLTYAQKMAEFDAFVAALWEINRQVMVATHLIVSSSRALSPQDAEACGLPADLCADMARAMVAAQAGHPMAETARRSLYLRHFRWEQERVVGTILEDAFDDMTWPLMRGLCLRPWVWFAYFRAGRSLNFRNFLDADERVEKGLDAYDRAAKRGWPGVELRLRLALLSLGRR